MNATMYYHYTCLTGSGTLVMEQRVTSLVAVSRDDQLTHTLDWEHDLMSLEPVRIIVARVHNNKSI